MDCPWLNVPMERRAEILVEPLYPRGGLLGGSSREPPKKSKLAALVAARKQKTQEAPSQSENSALTLLDTLTNSDDCGGATTNDKDKILRGRRYPLQRNEERTKSTYESQVQDNVSSSKPTEEVQELEPNAPVSSPSGFASTMLGLSSTLQHTPPNISSYNLFYTTGSDMGANSDPFSGASPDDIIAKAQGAAKGMKSKTQAKTNGQASKEVNTVSEDLSKTAITDSKPPRSKNLDVLQEYRKSAAKRSSNFVVIGKAICRIPCFRN